jgi:hypothetical protein
MNQPDVLDPEAAAFETMVERGIASLRSSALKGLSAPLAAAVPILDRWMLPSIEDPDGAPVPVLRVSPRRPDVADLGRVLGTEGEGGARLAWRWLPGHGFTADRLLLDVTIMRPVRAVFVLAFTLPRDRWVLDGIVRSGQLGLADGPNGSGSIALLKLPIAVLASLLAEIDGEG